MRNQSNGSGGLFNVDGNPNSPHLDDRQTGDLGGAQAPDPAGTLVLKPGQEKDRFKLPDGLAPTLEQRKTSETIAQENNGYIF